MRVSVGYRAVSNLSAAAVLWLCATGSAWAGGGGGGEDLNGLNGMVADSCMLLGIPTPPCPQLPTISQAVLQIAAWQHTPPEQVRATNNIVMGNHVDAGNPSRPPAEDKSVTVNGEPMPLTISEFPVPSVSMPPAIGLADLLPALTPLAFSSQNPEPSLVKRLYDPTADTFVYAVASGPPGAPPDTLYFFLEDLSRTNVHLPRGTTVAQISFLLTVLNSDLVTERAVPTTLLFRVPGGGKPPCSASSVVGDFNGSGSAQTLNDVSAIGVDCAVVFSPSPISTRAHAIFEVKLSLLITGATSPPNTDPVYFTRVDLFDIDGNNFYRKNVPPLSPLDNHIVFSENELGFTPAGAVLGTLGKYIGVAPSAGPLSGPLCTSAECPVPTFSLCANLPGGHGSGPHLVPAVAAFYAIATDGETYLSAPIVPEGIAPVCPAVPPG